jgi:hypothetical protein
MKWKLKPGVHMDDKTAQEVAKIACALKSVSMYTGLAFEEDSKESQELKQLVDEGLDAMSNVFDH